jgi:hypothetical protein
VTPEVRYASYANYRLGRWLYRNLLGHSITTYWQPAIFESVVFRPYLFFAPGRLGVDVPGCAPALVGSAGEVGDGTQSGEEVAAFVPLLCQHWASHHE